MVATPSLVLFPRSCRPAGSAHAEGLGQHGDQYGCPHLLTEQLVDRDNAKTLASHLSMWIATSSSPFALPGLLMAAIVSCMLLIGVVVLYLFESFLNASNPLNPLMRSIWRGSPLIKVARMLKIQELRDFSSSVSNEASSISFLLLGRFNQVVCCFACRLGRWLELERPVTPRLPSSKALHSLVALLVDLLRLSRWPAPLVVHHCLDRGLLLLHHCGEEVAHLRRM